MLTKRRLLEQTALASGAMLPGMRFPPSLLPDTETLARGLAAVLDTTVPVMVLERQPCEQGTFPKEIVTCRCGEGTAVRLFCKYGSEGTSHNCHGHRGGVAYEASVYRDLLQQCSVPTPKFYGSHTEPGSLNSWLILEYLADGVRLTRTGEPQAMSAAVEWIGCFHAENDSYLAQTTRPGLIAYDAEYYRGWARRTNEFAGPLHGHLPWLRTLGRRFEASAAPLLERLPTVIHGEYYPAKNILYAAGTIYPIDWESAAIGAGEIDLATLTEGWPGDVAQVWELQYQRTRWPGGGPPDFQHRLAAARLYLGFRWLGEGPDQTMHERNRWRFDNLRAVGERLGWI